MIPAGVASGRTDGVGLRRGGFVKPDLGRAQLSHALCFQFYAVRAVHQPVKHGVGDGRVADTLVPEFDRHLACHDGGRPVVPVIGDLHQVAPLRPHSARRGKRERQDQDDLLTGLAR